MAPLPPTPLSRAAGAVGALLGAVPAAVTRLRQRPPREPLGLLLLILLSAVLATVDLRWPGDLSPVLLAVPLLLGGLMLDARPLRQLAAVVVLCLAVEVAAMGPDALHWRALIVVIATGFVVHEFARSREEAGLAGRHSPEEVLVELRARLEQQGALPYLPAPWQVESVVRPAGGGPFAGDFALSAIVDEVIFESVLVDVSGKGVEAGTRALLLSGALGGLLGSKAPEEFLSAANAYLVRQDWEEGFATAVHLTLDLRTGEFVISSAGHPPPAHFDAGSGRWSLVEADGPALGLLDDVKYPPAGGTLRPGDALLLYTDGLVESRSRDLDTGIDKLLGLAEGLVTRGFEGGGELLVEQVAERREDDRGLVLLWRSPQ